MKQKPLSWIFSFQIYIFILIPFSVFDVVGGKKVGYDICVLIFRWRTVVIFYSILSQINKFVYTILLQMYI